MFLIPIQLVRNVMYNFFGCAGLGLCHCEERCLLSFDGTDSEKDHAEKIAICLDPNNFVGKYAAKNALILA